MKDFYKNRKPNDRNILLSAFIKFGLGIGIHGLFLFLCAGDIRYWNAWLYLAMFAAFIFMLGIYLDSNHKELLQKRLNSKENEKEQVIYTHAISIAFFSIFGVCGLDHKFGWSSVPIAAIIIALIIMLIGFGLFAITLTKNNFASRIVEIQDNQKVIDTGVYAVIRHPMYTAALTVSFASPIVLGSYYALIPMTLFLTGIIFRIRNEEKVLSEGLEGYSSYARKVKYRLIPFIW